MNLHKQCITMLSFVLITSSMVAVDESGDFSYEIWPDGKITKVVRTKTEKAGSVVKTGVQATAVGLLAKAVAETFIPDKYAVPASVLFGLAANAVLNLDVVKALRHPVAAIKNPEKASKILAIIGGSFAGHYAPSSLARLASAVGVNSGPTKIKV